MIRSMTGFGKAFGQEENHSLDIELKSVNSRYLEINIRMPRSFMALEESLKKEIAKVCSRGKFDVFLTFKSQKGDEVAVTCDETLAKKYLDCLRALGFSLDLKDDLSLSHFMSLEGLLNVTEESKDPQELYDFVAGVLQQALANLVVMREKEGANLKKDLLEKRQSILNNLEVIQTLSQGQVEKYHSKLTERLASFEQNVVSEERMAQELALFADRIAIDEEITRLTSHMDQLARLLDAEEPVGRKLDFLAQEMNREANTMTSKSQDLEITAQVLEIKADIEKIREQIQNIE